MNLETKTCVDCAHVVLRSREHGKVYLCALVVERPSVISGETVYEYGSVADERGQTFDGKPHRYTKMYTYLRKQPCGVKGRHWKKAPPKSRFAGYSDMVPLAVLILIVIAFGLFQIFVRG